jgi:transposase
VLANAAHIRNVLARKSDANDATWIADLLAHGLIRASFVPPAPIQELRDLRARASNLPAKSCSTSSAFRKCWKMPMSNWLP